jgi:nucleobase transporter 1/2
VGCILSGFWGSGNGSTSYSNNIGTITVTKVASRRVIQISVIIMIVLSLVGKAGAIFIGIPDPILGGMFCFIFPLITSVGIQTLSEVCLESARNIFIVSFAIFTGLAVSQWAQGNPCAIQTGIPELDGLLQILCSAGMFVAGITGFVLDNTKLLGRMRNGALLKDMQPSEQQKYAEIQHTTFHLEWRLSKSKCQSQF